MKVKVKHTSTYLQETRDLQIDDIFDVLSVGKRDDYKERKGDTFYLVQPFSGNVIVPYASEVIIIPDTN